MQEWRVNDKVVSLVSLTESQQTEVLGVVMAWDGWTSVLS